MASRKTQAVSTPLLIVFIIVVIIGAFMLFKNMSGGEPEVDESLSKLPKPPAGWDPKPPPNEPGVAGG